MLSREVMGVLCLGVVGITALLVAAAALQDLADLRRIVRLARGAFVGTARGDLAEWRVQQTGRAIDGPREAIAFHDRTFGGEVFASKLRVGEEERDVAASASALVWLSEEEREAAAACPSDAAFASAYESARKAKGYVRDVRVTIRDGARVFVIGKLDGDTITPEIVSTIDPVAFCRKKALLIALFIPVELAACAAAAALALVKPHFGHVSIAGALACFAFFLGVTPIAVALRENARRPHEAFLRTQWAREEERRGAKTPKEVV